MSMAKKRKITPEESDLFQQNVAGVKPLLHDKVVLNKKRTKPAKQYRPAPVEPLDTSVPWTSNPSVNVTAEETISMIKIGIQHKNAQKLKRGQFEIQAKLDLHGHTIVMAEHALRQFLAHCQQQHLRYVLIIHGKGQRAGDATAKLKTYVNHWLQYHPSVLAFHSAQPCHGGAGAVYVLLKTYP
ncbi:MAG: Smr/MutS family protein [Coxiellaceae bacterium]|nr:MAG: Smr/MutS family protein [Coxiellaceae bacterium]